MGVRVCECGCVGVRVCKCDCIGVCGCWVGQDAVLTSTNHESTVCS